VIETHAIFARCFEVFSDFATYIEVCLEKKSKQRFKREEGTDRHSPENERLEPKNHPIEKEIIFQSSIFGFNMLVFQGVNLEKDRF